MPGGDISTLSTAQNHHICEKGDDERQKHFLVMDFISETQGIRSW